MENLIKGLKVLIACILVGGFFYGIMECVKREEESYPKYIIRYGKDYWRTDTFNIDMGGCIHFVAQEYKLSGTKYKKVAICSKNYVIEEKWKRK